MSASASRRRPIRQQPQHRQQQPNGAANSTSADDVDRHCVPMLVSLAESYLHVADDFQGPSSAALSLVPDVASATLYASLALAVDPDHVDARRLVALCHLMGGTALVFPFAPSSFGHVRVSHGYQARPPSRASALSVMHLLQRGSRATFQDIGSARVYASACTALGQYKDAHDALEYTIQHGTKRKQADMPPACSFPSRDVYTSQLYTQLGHMSMKQAKYTEAANYFGRAHELDPLNWGAWTSLCDMATARPAADAWLVKPRVSAATSSGTTAPTTAAASAPASKLQQTKRARAPEPSTRPVRRVTPRAAALRSGMARGASANAHQPTSAPLHETHGPPVSTSVPPRTLSSSRTHVTRPLPQEDARKRVPSKTGLTGQSSTSVARGTSTRAAPSAPLAPDQTTSPTGMVLELTRDLAEAYRLVRRYEGAKAVALLCDNIQAPPRRRAFRMACVYCLLGRALHDMTEYTDAEIQFRRARALEPYLLMHMDIYSLVLFQLHREVALSALAQDLLAMDPRAAVAHIAAGNTWSLQHQHDAAYQCFRQATLVAPECAYAYTLAGYEALELEQPARAVRLFRCARRCDRRHWNALAGLGQVYLRQGHAVRASEAYAQAFLINRSNAVLLDLLGWALEQSGNWNGALAVYQRAIAMQPKAAMTRLKKAQLLLRLARACDDTDGTPLLDKRERARQRQAAHAELLRVCALAPSEPRVHLMLARSYMRMGGGRFAPGEDTTPPGSPGGDSDADRSSGLGATQQGTRLPKAFHAEITHHLATAVDLDPRCVREVNAMGDMPKLAWHGLMGGPGFATGSGAGAISGDVGAMVAEDDDIDDMAGIEDSQDVADIATNMAYHAIDQDDELDGYVWEG